MTQHRPGTIAALQYSQRPPLDFTDIVEEFDIAFQDDSISRRRLTWDCDDVAIFDRETVRVALGWMPPESEDQPWHLIVAVGTSPDAADTPITREFCEDMAAHILERTSEYLPYDAVLRSEADGAIDAEMIDTIAGQIQRAGRDSQEPRAAAPEESAPPSEDHTGNAAGGGAVPSWVQQLRRHFGSAAPAAEAPELGATSGVAASRIDLRSPSGDPAPDGGGDGDEARRLRESVFGHHAAAEISAPMHLSIYALGATMLLQAPPVGAALLVYTVLREDLRPSG